MTRHKESTTDAVRWAFERGDWLTTRIVAVRLRRSVTVISEAVRKLHQSGELERRTSPSYGREFEHRLKA